MSENQAAYDTDLKPFTREQILDICDYLGYIRKKGGYGEINIAVEQGAIRFIRLGIVSKSYDRNKTNNDIMKS